MSKFVRVRFFIFVVVFVSCDFELGRNVSCEESNVNFSFPFFPSLFASLPSALPYLPFSVLSHRFPFPSFSSAFSFFPVFISDGGLRMLQVMQVLSDAYVF